MKRVAILTGVLGFGTALTFAAAAVAATLFPNGSTVASNGWATRDWAEKGVIVNGPLEPPVIAVPGIGVEREVIDPDSEK